MSKLLFLVRDDAKDAVNGRALGEQLMERGHTVFLSDTDDDLQFFGGVVDAYVEVREELGDAVLYRVADKAAPSRDTLERRGVVGLDLAEEDLESLLLDDDTGRRENALFAMFDDDEEVTAANGRM